MINNLANLTLQVKILCTQMKEILPMQKNGKFQNRNIIYASRELKLFVLMTAEILHQILHNTGSVLQMLCQEDVKKNIPWT